MDSLILLLAETLAKIEGEDADTLHQLRWSHDACPEPLGTSWEMDYLPKAEVLAKAIRSAALKEWEDV